MKTTLDLPEEILAKLKNTAALEQRDVSQVAGEALARGLPTTAETHPLAHMSEAERRCVADQWLKEWQELGARISAKAVDPRSCVQILHDDRESRG